MRFKAFLIAATAVMSAGPAMAAGYGDFMGDWRNEDSGTNNITRIRVTPAGGGLKVKVWGKCSPSDCDWGSAPATVYGPGPSSNPASSGTDVLATFNTSGIETIVHLEDRPGDRLAFTSFTKFSDGRSPYVSTGTLRKDYGGWPPGGGGGGWPPGGGGGPGGGSGGITLFEHVGYGGGSIRLTTDTPNLAPLGWNDITSSIRVAPGETWQVCKHSNYAPPCRTIDTDVPNLVPGGWNDMISSVRRLGAGGGAPGGWPPGWPFPPGGGPGGPGGGPGGPGGPGGSGGGSAGGLSFAEDCINFDWHQVQAQFVGGEWKVVQGSMWMLGYGTDQSSAERAADVIRSYRFTQQCFIARPNSRMNYWKRNSGIPSNGLPGDDCVGNNPDTTRASYVGGEWKLVDGGHWMIGFGSNEAAARQAEEVVQTYRLNRQCWVSRASGGSKLNYWLAE